jgi:hypothetical protein
METTSIYSANRPPPPPPSPPPRFGDNRPNFEPFEQQQDQAPAMEPAPYMYYEPPPPQQLPEPEKTFMESISKKVLFVIFLAFVIGLFVGKFMSQATVVNLK